MWDAAKEGSSELKKALDGGADIDAKSSYSGNTGACGG